MTKKDVINSIPKLEQIFVIYSRLTRLPYVECNAETFDDEVYIYTDETAAHEKVNALTDDKQISFSMKIEKKEMLRIFSELYGYGVNAVVFQTGKEVFHIQLNEIVRRPDFSRLPEDKRPLENPQLQLSMIYLMQELRRGLKDHDREHVKELEDEMLHNIMKARFLAAGRETEQNGEKQLQMLLLKGTNGTPMIPIFSDGTEYNHALGKQECKAVITDFEKMANMNLPKEIAGFIINPAGVGVPLPKELIQRLQQTYTWK